MTKILTLLLLSTGLLAIEKSIEITANKVEINHKTGISHYSGDVIFTQGLATISAKNIYINQELKENKQNEYRVVAKGGNFNKAVFSIKGDDAIFSSANKIIYTTKQSFIQLIGEAKFSQNGNNFAGEKINYDLKKDQVLMSGNQNKRVKLKIKL